MNTIDLIVILPLALAVISGYRKGFIIEIASLVAFVLAIIACLKFTHKLMEFIKPWTGDSKWLPFISYLIIFIIVYIIVLWIGKLLEKVIKIIQLGFFNRILGVIFSLLRMCFIISLIFWLANQVHLIPKSAKTQSYAYQALNHFASDSITFISNHLPYVKGEVSQIENYFDGIAK
jgi:membrane protein required for colicin V production